MRLISEEIRYFSRKNFQPYHPEEGNILTTLVDQYKEVYSINVGHFFCFHSSLELIIYNQTRFKGLP